VARQRGWFLFWFLFMFLLAGCSTSGAEGSDHDAAGGDRGSGARTLPIEAYILTADQRKVVHRAVQHLANECMKRQGFDVGLPDLYQPTVNGRAYGFLDRRYAAVNDEKTARQYGLHVPLYVENPRPPAEPEMSQEAIGALWGPPGSGHARDDVDVSRGRLSSGGCVGQAESQLALGTHYIDGIGEGYAGPVRILNLDNTPDEDPRVIAAQAAWSSCMAEAGYQLKSTLDDQAVPGVDLATPLPSRAEVALAVREVRCQDRTKVVDIAFEVESEYEVKKIDEQAEVFAEIRKENEELIQRAADLLGEEVP
jgi:hypothetical protein